MNWILLALISPLFYAAANVLDKIVTGNFIKKSHNYLVIIGISYVGYAVLLPFVDVTVNTSIIYPIIGGFLHFMGIIFYLKALKDEDASTIAPLMQMSPLYVLLLSIVFLSETLRMIQILAFFLIITGAIFISLKIESLKLSKAFFLMNICAFFFAVNGALIKYSMNYLNSWTIVIFNAVGHLVAVGLILFNVKKTRNFVADAVKFSLPGWILAIIANVAALTGHIFLTFAAETGPISLVTALGTFHAVYVFILSIAVTMFVPKLLKEPMNIFILAKKLVSILLMVVGLTLLYIR